MVNSSNKTQDLTINADTPRRLHHYAVLDETNHSQTSRSPILGLLSTVNLSKTRAHKMAYCNCKLILCITDASVPLVLTFNTALNLTTVLAAYIAPRVLYIKMFCIYGSLLLFCSLVSFQAPLPPHPHPFWFHSVCV